MGLKESINEANEKAFNRILSAKPRLIDFEIAKKIIPDMKENSFLHAGPPVEWENISGPQKGAIIGAIIYEGLADDPDNAEKIAAKGEITLSPCHEHQCVGPMAGVISPSMPVMVVENKEHKNKAFSNLNEGLGKVLRFGAYSDEVIDNLRWMEETLYPTLKTVINEIDPIDLNSITAQALQMNDEVHNRNVAASMILLKKFAQAMIDADIDRKLVSEVYSFISENEHFYLNFSMANSKASMDSILGIEYCTLLTAMTRNGTDFGIRVSATNDEWFTTKAPEVDGLYFSGYGKDDAALDMGDSSISETRGVGGFAMAASPSIVQFVGGTPSDALNYTKEMYEITQGEDTNFSIPQLDFRGVPVGIDLRKVLRKGIAPIINTGIAHKDPGVGQIGAGVVRAPMEVFKQALKAFSEKYEGE